MKPSTAIKKARKHHVLLPFGNQWQVVNYPLGANYSTSTSNTTYAQARQWYKENITMTALQLMGWDEEDALIVGLYNTGKCTAQELVERCLNHA